MTSDYGEFLMIQDELMVDIMECIDPAGTSFAFPSQTAYIARDTGLDEEIRARVERQAAAAPTPPDGSERTGLPEDDLADDEAAETAAR